MFKQLLSLLFLLLILFPFKLTGQCAFVYDLNTAPVTCNGGSDGQIALGIDPINDNAIANIEWSVPTDDPQNLSGLTAGTYSVTITDITGCVVVDSATVSEPPPLPIELTPTNVTCNGGNDGNIFIQIPADVSIQSIVWSEPDDDDSDNLIGVTAGVYSVTVTYDQNCTATADTTISEPPPIVLDCSNKQDVSAPDANDGQVTINVPGGVSTPYNVIINGPKNDTLSSNNEFFIFTGLPVGDYVAKLVTIDPDCTSELCNFSIDLPPCSITVDGTLTEESCFQSGDGTVELAVTGGTSPYDFQWNNGAVTGTISNLTAGVYTVTVTDQNDCDTIQSFLLDTTQALTVNCVPVTKDTNDFKSGAAEITVNNGSPPFNFSWTGPINGDQDNLGEGETTLGGLFDGEYFLTVTDANGCTTNCMFWIDGVIELQGPKEFVLEYKPGMPPMPGMSWIPAEFREEVTNSLISQDAILRRQCDCRGDGQPLLEHWGLETFRTLILDATHQPSMSSVDVDTSGVGTLVLDPEPADTDEASDVWCIQSQRPPNYNHQVTIAIIDSGIDVATPGIKETGHTALANSGWVNPGEPIDEMDSDSNCIADDLAGYDYIDTTIIITDEEGHGTHLAGIVALNYPADIELEIINLKVYGENGGDEFDLSCAINYAIDKGAQVINLSLGYPDSTPSRILYNALKRALDQNIIVVLSAGNEQLDLDDSAQHPEQTRWPVKFKNLATTDGFIYEPIENLIVVTALDPSRADLDFSYANYSDQLVDFATESNFFSTHLNNDFMALKGTSMAAAYITRMMSIAKAYTFGSINPRTALECLRGSTATLPSGDTLTISRGLLLEDAALRCLNINRPPAGGTFPFSGIPDGIHHDINLKRGDNLVIRLGDGSVVYENVTLVVKKLKPGGSEGEYDEVFRHNCFAASTIIWNCVLKDGSQLPTGEQYFIDILVGPDQEEVKDSPLGKFTYAE